MQPLTDRPGRKVCSVAVCLLLSVVISASPALVGAQSRPGGSSPAGSPTKELVAVLDLEAVGSTAVEASAMTERLREELLRSGQYTLVDRAQMAKVLDEQALQQTGCTSNECAVQVGKILGVRKLVTGKITKLAEDRWLLTAQLIDVESAQTQRAESIRFRGDYFSMLDHGILELVQKLSGVAPVAAAPMVPPAARPPQPGASPAQQEAQPESGGISKWWWIAGGAVLVGAAAAGSSSKSSKKSSSSAGSCTSGCGTVGYTW